MAPRTQPSTNRCRGIASPEIWFRIVHLTLDDSSGSVAYREQTVEVALGPKGAFGTANLGRLTRRVPASQVVSAVPERLRQARPPREPRGPRLPPVVETLRKALDWRRELDAGEVLSQADIARREGLTRARVTQVLILLRLCPDIQKAILAIRESPRPPAIGENVMRPIACLGSRRRQLAAFEARMGTQPVANP